VLVVEDILMVRRLLAMRLAREPDLIVVGEAEDGVQAVALARELHPDVVLMDVGLPRLDGMSAARQILCEQPDIRIVIVSGQADLAGVGEYAGASACLDKSCTPTELVEALRRAAHPDVAAPGSDEDAEAPARFRRSVSRLGLTEKETLVLYKIAMRELTVAEIARELTEDLGDPVTPGAIRHTVERVMTKLRIEPRTRATLVRYLLQLR
jgi:DNA-binding NarL/FixJ family response regulator